MNHDTELKYDEQLALQYAKRVKEFYESAITYSVLAAVFLFIFHDRVSIYMLFAAIGVGVIVQSPIAFEKIQLLSPSWERKLIERKLGRKL